MVELLSNNPPGIWHWLILSTILFSIGLYGVLIRKSAVGVLMSAELMLNAAVLNFVVFNHFVKPFTIDGELMGIFIIAVAAAEAVVAMAIFVAIFKHKKSIDITHIETMKG
ncbi:MAG: NADH-quinone oxidoreductase subunit NuoK [SAR324 cluster bacterium]|nr:NADH-quinone oxidoreductase subunit NuoK [SAR324 cluster bacterium]